jgi:oxygen-independent coproporphyrinogen III oxidase
LFWIKLPGRPLGHSVAMNMATSQDTQTPVLSLAQLARLDVPGPRYTSYPTADRFGPAFTADNYCQALRQRGASDAPVSLYVHVPFCEQLCWYCACNKIITRHKSRGTEYLGWLQRELELHSAEFSAPPAVSQLHLGGGSPTFLSDEELGQLMALLRQHFRVLPNAELSIEVDPRTASPERLKNLSLMGFNRLSFGVQDFDADVQQAVHRIQPYEQVHALIEAARALPFDSVNVDLIYGLPKQHPASFQRTLAQVVQLRPSRIALYAYAHLPLRFKPQRRIERADLPSAPQRVQMLGDALASFVSHGYVYIGMDHFALPEDALAVAKREGRLHRNFQGYTTQPDCDLIALGVSSIGRVGATYSQNAKTLEEYQSLLAQGRFPVVRGLALNSDDLLRRDVIMALMCQGRVDFAAIEQAHGVDFAAHFKPELQRLREHETMGLVCLSERDIQLTASGWYFVRALAMVFDRYLQLDPVPDRFSRVV